MFKIKTLKEFRNAIDASKSNISLQVQFLRISINLLCDFYAARCHFHDPARYETRCRPVPGAHR